MYAVIQVHLVSLFSLRAVTTNAFTARTLLCPTPAALKMAMVSHLIARDGANRTPEELLIVAQGHVDWLAPLRVAWSAPALLATTAVTMTVLKDNNGNTPLIRSVGMREYAHYDQPFGLAIGPVPVERRTDLLYALEGLRALGIAESLVQPLAPPVWHDEVPEGYVWLTAGVLPDAATRQAGEVCVLDDLGRAPSFERLSVYRPAEARFVPRLGEDRRRSIVVLPLRQRRQHVNGRVMERR